MNNNYTGPAELEYYFNSSSIHERNGDDKHNMFSDFMAIAFSITISVLAIFLHIKKERFLESRNAEFEAQRRRQQEAEDLKKKKACPERRKKAFSKLIETKVSCLILSGYDISIGKQIHFTFALIFSTLATKS